MKYKTSLQVLGERIRKMRKAMKLSQEDLALEADMDRSYIGGVERGERNLTVGKLCDLARVLRCDVGRLCRGLPIPQEKR